MVVVVVVVAMVVIVVVMVVLGQFVRKVTVVCSCAIAVTHSVYRLPLVVQH